MIRIEPYQVDVSIEIFNNKMKSLCLWWFVLQRLPFSTM
nr:MAG TPA: hypothetical protein [Caudoviricetes sp.]